MMRSDTQLDYAVFQLTPTRTRCELLVAAQGKTYKLASGLLKPFVAHLRVAEEQIAKGGYSIRLELPDHCLSAKWFTKGTMERFVRFVSTPEVLERVSTVETELSELEEAVRIQESNTSDETDMVEDSLAKTVPSPSSTRVKSTASANIERLAKPLDAAENSTEGNTKHCLLRALDARRLMLQKEQGMSFARAIAAGFSIEYMDDLVSFAECFGADRLREACLKFIALCKKRQESGLWQDDLDLAAVETARVMGGTGDIQEQLDETRRASFPIERMAPMGENILRNHTRRGSLDGLAAEHLQGASAMRPPGTMGDYSPSMWSKNGVEYRDAEAERRAGYIRAHPVMAAWPGHLGPLSPHEAMQHSSLYGFPSPGMPYPQHLGSPYMQSPYAEKNGWHMHAPTYWPGNHNANAFGDGVPLGLQQTPPRVMAERDGQGNIGAHQNHRSPRNDDEEKDRDKSFNDGDMEPETRRSSQRSVSPRRRSVSPKRKGSSGSKRSGMVVIRNINYITPSSQDHHPDTENNDTDSSLTNSEDDQHDNGNGTLNSKTENGRSRLQHSTGLSESKNRYINERDTSFCMDRAKSPVSTHDPAETEFRMSSMSHKIHDNTAKRGQLMDNMFRLNERERTSRSREMHSEMLAEQGGQGNKRISASHDSFILPESRRSLTERDSRIIDADFEISGKSDQSFPQKDGDDSFIVYDRIVAREETNIDWRTPLNLDGEVPSSKSITADATKPVQCADEYFEPDDLFMIPERNKDTVNRSWNTPVDYDMEVLAGDARHGQELESSMGPSVNEQECKELEVKSKENLKESGKGTKARTMRPAIVRPGKPNPLVEAQLRAEKLRAYKADLQKSKREKEDEERKRIEDLKRQRQERIASRSSANAGSIKSSTNRTIRATPLNASRSSLSTVPRIMPTSSPGSGAPSFMSPRTRDLINTKSSRVTENVVSHSVPSLNELQRVSAKASPARASAGGSQQPQLKRNMKDKDSLSVHKTNAHIEEKRAPLSLTTVIKKGNTLGKDTKIEGSALVKSTRVPTVVNKQEKKPTISAGSTRPLTQEQTTSDMGKVSGSTQTGRLINTEGSKQAQKIEPPVTEEHASMSATEGEHHPYVPKEEKAYVQIRAPESSEKEITVTAVDVNHHLLEAKCGEHTMSEKYHTILEECSTVKADQSEQKSGSHIGSLSTGDVVQSEDNGDNEELNYHAPVARLSTDEKSCVEEKHDACQKLSGTDRYDAPYALMSSIDFDKDAEYKEANVLDKNAASYGTPEHPSSHTSGHFGSAPYAPPTDSPVITPSKNIPSLHDAIQQAQSAESDSITSKSRKKWVGDAGASQKTTPKEHSAKGLKKLLLLGRKSSRSPLQSSSELNPGSMASEERDEDDDDDDEDDPSLSKNKSKSKGMHVGGFRAKSPDGFSSEGKSHGPSQRETTPTKSSRSFFSLPTFRTKGEGKA